MLETKFHRWYSVKLRKYVLDLELFSQVLVHIYKPLFHLRNAAPVGLAEMLFESTH